MSELFPPESVSMKSPRLEWLERHRLVLHDFGAGGESPETGMDFKRWVCRVQEPDFTERDCGAHGDTQEDAIADWARRNGVKLWNEEGV